MGSMIISTMIWRRVFRVPRSSWHSSLEKEIIIFKMEKDLELLGKGAISLIANTKLNVSTVLIIFIIYDI